jgi:hypothetical protein
MGCTGSTFFMRRQRAIADKKEYDRRPRVSVRILPQVKKVESLPTIIFIFGKFEDELWLYFLIFDL